MESLIGLDVLLQEADESMSVSSHAVPVWSIPGAYIDNQGHIEAKRIMEIDAQAAYTTALAYRLTGKASYADKTIELLKGWATVNKALADNDGPLVSAYLGVGLIRAALFIKPYSGWKANDKEQFIHWMTTVCLASWDGIRARNNWWNWSLYAQLALFHFTEDKTNFALEVENLKEHLDLSIDSNGFIAEETLRGRNGIWYHYFALAPATAAAKLILDATGEDLFRWVSPSGKSIKLALDKLFYYINGHADEWPFEPNQSIAKPAPHTWTVELYEAMAGVYQDPDYEQFTAPYRPVVGNKNYNTGYYMSYSWIHPTLLRKAGL